MHSAWDGKEEDGEMVGRKGEGNATTPPWLSLYIFASYSDGIFFVLFGHMQRKPDRQKMNMREHAYTTYITLK